MDGSSSNELYNFKSCSSISTNYNSRPRSTYQNQRQKVGRLIKNQQSRSVSPNTFQPLFLESKSNNSKNTFLLKKYDNMNNNLQDVQEANNTMEFISNFDNDNNILQQQLQQQQQQQQQLSQQKQNQKRPASSNGLVRISQQRVNSNKQIKQNNYYSTDLPQVQMTQQEDIVSSTNNTYYNQFYNVSKILVNPTENNLDLTSSFLDYTNNSVKNGLNKSNMSVFNNLDTNDHSQFNSNSKSNTKSKILTENGSNLNKIHRSLNKISSRNISTHKDNNNNIKRNILTNSKSFMNKSTNEFLRKDNDDNEDNKYNNYNNNNNNNNNNNIKIELFGQNRDSIENSSNKKDEKENKQQDDELQDVQDKNENKNHVKKEYMDEKEVKNISFYINNMMYEDFKVYTDAQLLSKMDRESLIIRLQLLEQENKEIKCHNLHLSSKFKQMLDEYTRYKEYQDNIDRKSLYQKPVQKLAELSKICHDQSLKIEQYISKIASLNDTIDKKEKEIVKLNEVINQYDEVKQKELIDIENRFKDQIKEYQERVEYLNKENRKITLLEISYKDVLDKMNEDKNKFLNALDKSEDRYKLLSNKQTEKDREIWSLKEKIKELEYSIKFNQEQNNVIIQEKCNEYDKKLQKLEIEQHTINIQYSKQEKQLIAEIQQAKEINNDLRKQLTDNDVKMQEQIQGLSNVIQSQNEQYSNYKMDSVNQIAAILQKNESLENQLEEKISIIEDKKKDIISKTNKINELYKKIESIIQSKEKMKEEHQKEMNQLFKNQQDSTSSLTFKIKEMKLYYEVEIENMKKECEEKIKEHSSNATDAKRQYFAMKNNYSQDIEGKENEIDFLKNKIFEEKQKIKDQIDTQYKDMIKDMQKRITFLQSELDDQKIEIENTICEDLAVYNRQSKYWKKSRDIREEKYSYKSINSEDSRKQNQDMPTPIKKKSTTISRPNNQPTHQDIVKIKFQTVAKCAAAFEEQQQKIEKLRNQIDVLSKKANNLLKQQYLISGGKGQSEQQLNNNNNILQRQNALEINEGITLIQSDNELLLNENDIKDLELAKQVKDLRDQLYQQKLKNQEIQDQFIKREYELNENHKQQTKKMQQSFDSQNQIKIQQVFEKDIQIEKQQSKIIEFQKLLEESTILNTTQIQFVENMKNEFKELENKNQTMLQILRDEKEELMEMWENRESLSKDIIEIERLNNLINKLNNEIKSLKTQILNLHHSKNNNTSGGLVFESQLRTSYDNPITQKLQPIDNNNSNSNNANTNTYNVLNKNDSYLIENRNKSKTKQDITDINKNNINKSIPINNQKDQKIDYTRKRTKTSFRMDKDNQDQSSINSNKNN